MDIYLLRILRSEQALRMGILPSPYYAMMKLATPKRVTLPNGRTFVARCKRIKISELPPSILMRRT